jgi:hypothetical protein
MAYVCPVHGNVEFVKPDEYGVLRCKAIRGSAIGLVDCGLEVDRIPGISDDALIQQLVGQGLREQAARELIEMAREAGRRMGEIDTGPEE